MSIEQLLSKQVIDIIQPIVQEYENRLHRYDSRINDILELQISINQIRILLGYKTNASIDRLFERQKLINVSTNSFRKATIQDVLNYKNSIEK
ncbi:hypothetical protein [Francisella salimarina]|uniref:Uncharacterized protein n=1 Tax=Francisella salimarina TaxID=2599927 RepID=A0AAJ4NLU6_9GAMM|nr:hypothetical protein [Francisella salimarina]QWU98527.1 hypothetical protein KQR59_05275 [Francisella salimarina]